MPQNQKENFGVAELKDKFAKRPSLPFPKSSFLDVCQNYKLGDFEIPVLLKIGSYEDKSGLHSVPLKFDSKQKRLMGSHWLKLGLAVMARARF